MEIGGREVAAKTILPPPPSATALAGTAGMVGVLQQQQQQHGRENWFSRWRWVLAAVAVIVLGRISSF